MIETRNTTVTLTANTEKTVEFAAAYNYFYVKNDSSAPLYVSMLPNIAAGADGVFSCAAGESIGTLHGYPANKLYLLGEGTVQACGVGSADNPFKVRARGGDSYVHPTGSGYKHIPSGGTVGQILKNTADGTAEWSNLQIGGTNLLLNSDFSNVINDNAIKRWSRHNVTTVASDGVLKVTPINADAVNGMYSAFVSITDNPTKTYTLTAFLKADTAKKIRATIQGKNESGAITEFRNTYVDLTTEWQKVTVNITLTKSDTTSMCAAFYAGELNDATAFYIKKPKLEAGTESTDWSPSPYDVPLSVQKGTVTTGSDGTATVTFPTAFNYTPNVQATPRDDGATGGTTASILSVNTTSFKVKANKTSNTAMAVAVDWIALEV